MTISLKNKLRVNLVIEEEQVIVTPESSLFGLYYLSKKNRLILENAINRIKNILAIENIDPIIITRYA